MGLHTTKNNPLPQMSKSHDLAIQLRNEAHKLVVLHAQKASLFQIARQREAMEHLLREYDPLIGGKWRHNLVLPPADTGGK